jgi:aryl-alcohol dehydrogenase-like predicted oxidoreductase
MSLPITCQLGHDGPIVSTLGIGTWAWGDRLFWSYGKDYDEAQLKAAFTAAIAGGVTLFDTAEIYGLGESERLLGRFAKAETQENSSQIRLATKYFPLPWRTSEAAVHDALTASLDRLGTTEVSLYQVHWPFDFFMGQPTLMKALAAEYKRGRIKSIGVSNYSAAQMRQAQETLARYDVPLAVNQVQYSLLARQIETNGVLGTARELGITILAYSPLAQGLLTGKYDPATLQIPTGARRFDRRFSKEGLEKLTPLLNVLREVGQTHNKSIGQIALAWLMAESVIPIPGAKTATQVTQNVGAIGLTLSSDEREAIGTIKMA